MKFNPLYILGLLLVVLIFAVYKTQNKEEQIRQANLQLQTLTSKAKELEALKQSWEDRGEALKKIRAALSHPVLRDVTINEQQKKSAYVLEFPNLNKQELNHVSSKLLNETLVIKRFELERLDDANATLAMEIGL